MKNFLYAKFWRAVYDGEGDAAAAAAASAAAAAAAAQDPPKTFTQEQVNKMLAEDKRKHQAQVQQTVTQLEEFKKQKGLSEKAQAELQTRIEELNSSLLSKEEQTKRELERKDKEYKEALDKTSSDREYWQTNYTNEVTRNQIIQASITHEAVRSEQLLELLGPKTRLVPVLDQDGKTIKGYAPKVKFQDKNEKGEDIELDLSVEDAVKRMKELPERFGNLFKSGVAGGIGGSGGGGSGGGPPSLQNALKNPQAWRENRQKLGLGRKK